MADADSEPAILFTAFEPSGDDLAASAIAALRRRWPEARVAALGGAKMAEAGAELIERTGADAVVGMPGPAKIIEHWRLNRRIARWLDGRPIRLHVPVDSPAANFPICKLTKSRGAGIVHLAAPQLWAWAPWRIRKLRRLTDHLLCLLPFEPAWFETRGVPATFVGHPIFDEPIDREAWAERTELFPKSSPRVAIMPGSRPAELSHHMPLLLQVLRRLQRSFPQIGAVIAAPDQSAATRLERIVHEAPGLDADRVAVAANAVDAAAAWADVALTKSGTITLRLARHRTPMVVVYRTNPLGYALVGRWLITTSDRAMPNLIAGRRIVPEFVPHLGGPAPIVHAVERLLDGEAARESQRRALDEVSQRFEGRNAGESAAKMIAKLTGLGDARPSESADGSAAM